MTKSDEIDLHGSMVNAELRKYFVRIGRAGGLAGRGWRKSAAARKGVRERWRRWRTLQREECPCGPCRHGPRFADCPEPCECGRAYNARVRVGAALTHGD